MSGRIREPGAIHRRSGFTLIEMLVVIAIIGLLAGILLSAVGGIKAKALDNQVDLAVKDLAMAIRAYHSEIGDWPIPADGNPEAGGSWSNDNYKVFALLAKQQNHRRNYLELTNLAVALSDSYGTGTCYVVTIDVTNNTVEVKSAGRDHLFGSGDDKKTIY